MVLILAEGSLGVAIGVMGTMGMSLTAEDLASSLSVPPLSCPSVSPPGLASLLGYPCAVSFPPPASGGTTHE